MNDDDRRWLAARFDALEQRVDRQGLRQIAAEDRAAEHRAELEARTRSLELWKSFVLGVTAVISAATAWLAGVAQKWL